MYHIAGKVGGEFTLANFKRGGAPILCCRWYNDGNNVWVVHAFLDLQVSSRPQRIRATAAILLFLDYEYNYSVPGGNCQCLIWALFTKFLPANLSGYMVSRY